MSRPKPSPEEESPVGKCPWEQGLSPHQIDRVRNHRRISPNLPLPAYFQCELGRSWCAYAARTQQ
jgi:hypothetical protein